MSVVNKMQVKNSIRWQMVVVICGVIFVSFLLFSTVVRNILIDDYRQLVQNNDRQLLQILSYNISKSMSKPLGLEHLAAVYPSLMKLDDQGKYQVLLRTLLEDSSFEMLSVVSTDGTHTTNTLPTEENPSELYQKLKSVNVVSSNSPDKEQNPNIKEKGESVSDIKDRSMATIKEAFISPVRYADSTKNLVLTFVHEIKENNQVQGAVVANINLKSIYDIVMNFNGEHHSSVYLIDQDGTAIAQPSEIGEGLFNYDTLKVSQTQHNHSGYVLYDENGQVMTSEKDFSAPQGLVDIIQLAKRGESGESEYTNNSGEKFFCVYQPVDLPFVDTNWSIILVHASADMTALIDNLFVKALVIGFIMLIFASFTILYFSERLTKPIFQIVEMANRVRAGDLSGQLHIKNDNEIGLLADNINHMIQGLRATRRKSRETEKQIKAIAYHDTLTGLPNRMHFMIYLREMLERNIKGRFYGALLFIDVDKFKSINDNYGHAAGDDLLIAFANRIVEIAGRKEIVCRFGGDEFLLFLPGYNDTDAKAVCEQLVKIMRNPFNISGNEFSLSTSIGAALFPKDADNIDDLMEKADAALYVSKRNGRDQYNFFVEGMETVLVDERD